MGTSLIKTLMTIYLEIFLVYIRNIPFINCKKSEEIPFDSKTCYIIFLCEYVFKPKLCHFQVL
jgi:hypothetical protein